MALHRACTHQSGGHSAREQELITLKQKELNTTGEHFIPHHAQALLSGLLVRKSIGFIINNKCTVIYLIYT